MLGTARILSIWVDGTLRQLTAPDLAVAYFASFRAGLALSPDGNHLLSNSMDNSVMMWDVRPFANDNRLEKTFHGIKVNTYA